jgi:Di-haem oxidoreductase, putative peroxidase
MVISDSGNDLIAAIYGAIIEPSGWDEVASCIVEATKLMSGGLIMEKANAAHQVELAEWQLLETLAPHLQRAAAIHDLLGRVRAITNTLGEAVAAAGFAATASSPLGIEGHPNQGHPNRSGNDNTITRFGWKAQNKSITMFAAEAYNVEMGITNELFPTATEEDPACNGPEKPEPNDVTRTATNDKGNQYFNNPKHILADWMQFQILRRFIDAPHRTRTRARARSAGGMSLATRVAACVTRRKCRPRRRSTAPSCRTGPSICSRIYWCITCGGDASPMTSSKGRLGQTSFARRHFGAWDSVCSSCMMAAQTTCLPRSSSISHRKRRLIRRRKPMQSYRIS